MDGHGRGGACGVRQSLQAVRPTGLFVRNPSSTVDREGTWQQRKSLAGLSPFPAPHVSHIQSQSGGLDKGARRGSQNQQVRVILCRFWLFLWCTGGATRVYFGYTTGDRRPDNAEPTPTYNRGCARTAYAR